MTGVGSMFLEFFVLKIWVTGDPMVDKGSKEIILDLVGRGFIFVNGSGFLAVNNLMSFLFCLTSDILGHQWPCGKQSIPRVHYRFLKMLKKMFFWLYIKRSVVLGTIFIFVFDFWYLGSTVTLW